MAWSVEYFDHYSGYLSDDYSVPVQLAWGRFSVVELRIDGSIEVASIALSSISGVTQGAARGYICTSPADFADADEVPTNYIATFGPDTTDIAEINVWMAGNPLYAVMVPWSMYTTGFVQFNFAVDGGGGGGNDPFYTAQGDDQNGAIDIRISNYTDLSYDKFVYYIKQYGSDYLPPYETSAPSHTFGSLENGDYTISVSYYYNGNEYYLPSRSGATITDITISGGGGGGGDEWGRSGSNRGIITQSVTYPNVQIKDKTVVCYMFQFTQSMEVSFYSTGDTDTKAWLCTPEQYNQGIYPDTGEPISYIPDTYNDDGGDGSNFLINYTVSSGYYVLCFRTYYGDEGWTEIHVDTSTTPSWYYNDGDDRTNISSQTNVYAGLSSYFGMRFRVSFAYSGMASFVMTGNDTYVYVTKSHYGYNAETGNPYDEYGNEISGAASLTYDVTSDHGYYYVWIRGRTGSVSGNIPVTITPPVPSEWTEVYAGDVYFTGTSRTFNRQVDMMRVYRYNISFSSAGKVRIRSSGGTADNDPIAYFGTTNNGIRSSDGIPVSYNNEWDDSSSGSETDRNFDSGEISISAGTTYYLWVKCYRDTQQAQLVIYIDAIADTGGKVWIYTSSGWKQAVPWVYTSSGWKQAVPWVYTLSGWKQTT